ncbi:hypothetical protein N7532_000125 [Penicillium argentinense]|uniref:Nitrogen regulatory protein areA GATA-like domain-containing protein n=1 Tax=Penicillium argentinense TaxID=1131581 RepID=A0A9W9KMZ0_9EURO|nr:uncharacterized protein N7532_000125 [Penicillium argentinense]KAJ5112080.1 hypothetical protein N7532_000125 [Penicillium argentinense]
MTAVLAHERPFSPDPLRSPTTQRYFLHDHGIPFKSPMQDEYPGDCPSPVASTLSCVPSPNFTPTGPDPLYTPTNLSSLSLDENDLILPAYDTEPNSPVRSQSEEEEQFKGTDLPSDTSVEAAVLPPPRASAHPAADDTSVEDEPSRHVDYLSHEWKEEDIWASWRYVTTRKSDYSNGVRLENASWRTWTKAKNNLGTISPETLNWLKDCDVTWLYGPLKTSASSDGMASDGSPPPSRLETPNSYLERKPILKKKTASETILQRSLSQHTLLQHAGAILKAQEAASGNGWTRPPFSRSSTDLDHIHHRTGSSTYSLGGTLTASSSSGLTSPSERKHIHFNNEVVQCIAVEAKEGDDEDWPLTFDDESFSDEGVVMMRQISGESSLSNRSTPRNSFSSDSKTIAPLPSTTLKYRPDTPDPRESILDRWSSTPSSASTLSPTPSVETLRPPTSSANFLLDDEDEDPSLDFTGHYRRDQPWFVPEDENEPASRPMRLTASGMFMPYSEGEGEPASNGLLGRVVDTVNTARDIAHVIWNVGWRR